MEREDSIVVSPTRTTQTHVRREHTDMAYENVASRREYHREKTVWRAYHTVWFVIGIIEALLAFRFLFELLAANPNNEFAQLVYGLSYPFAAPFQSIFGITSLANSLFDWSLIVAAAVYMLIGYGIVQMLRIIKPVHTEDTSQTVVVR